MVPIFGTLVGTTCLIDSAEEWYEGESLVPLLSVESRFSTANYCSESSRGCSKVEMDAVADSGCSGAGACPGDVPLGNDRTKLEVSF